MVVLSVDGVNVISGETAASQQSGYVLGPWEQTEISGWRKSQQEVAQFYFTALPDSYAARTERPDNVGVIGAAVFREKVEPLLVVHYAQPSAAAGRNQWQPTAPIGLRRPPKPCANIRVWASAWTRPCP